MEVESGVGWQTSAPQVLVLDLDSMGSGEAIDPLPDMLQNVILLSLASGTSGPTLIPSLAIYAIRRNSVITVMQSTTLVPAAWGEISASILRLRELLREFKFGEPASSVDPQTIEECLETILNKENKDAAPRNLRVQMITQRIEDVSKAVRIFIEWPKSFQPIRLIVPETDLDEESFDEKNLEVVFFRNSDQLSGVLKQGYLMEGMSRTKLAIEVKSKGNSEMLWFDLHRRTINLEQINNPLFKDGKTANFRGICFVREDGLCDTVTSGDTYLAVPSSSSSLSWPEQQENKNNVILLHRELFAYGNCLIVQSERNFFVLRTLGSSSLFGLKRLSSAETLMPLPVYKEPTQTHGGWRLLNIMKDLPREEVYNPLEYRTNLIPELETWALASGRKRQYSTSYQSQGNDRKKAQAVSKSFQAQNSFYDCLSVDADPLEILGENTSYSLGGAVSGRGGAVSGRGGAVSGRGGATSSVGGNGPMKHTFAAWTGRVRGQPRGGRGQPSGGRGQPSRGRAAPRSRAKKTPFYIAE